MSTLSAPTSLSATPSANGVVTLAWTKSASATDYPIFRGSTANPTTLWTTVGDVATWSESVIPGTYHYRLKAVAAGYTTSIYSSDVNAVSTTLPPNTLNFGNGVYATGHAPTATSAGIMGHSGLDCPEVELPALENAIADGGSLGSSRAKMRRMTVALDFGYFTTRSAVAALFTPGVSRTLTSPRGSMTYYVASLAFDSANLTGPVRCSVVMLSSLAYPEGAELSQAITGTTAFNSASDVPVAPKVTVTVPAGGATSLVVVSDAGTTTITRTLAAGKVVVIDAKAHTVTYDGADSIASFDRTGVWPGLIPSTTTVAVTIGTGHSATITWKPRLMGLLT